MAGGIRHVIERWTPGSPATVGAASAALLVLACGPLFLGDGAVDRLTTLFVYVLLGVTWNAMAGYGGLVPVGQQGFFGLGAYFAVRPSDAGVSVYPALLLAAVIVGAIALPVSMFMLRLRAGEFAIGT